MKKILLPVLLLIFTFSVNAQSDRFVKAMKKNIAMMDTVQSLTSVLAVENNFERVANAEKDKWLAYYYSAYLLTISNFMDTVVEKKDIYLDKAEQLAALADSLEPNNSEIYTLKGMIAQGKLTVDPQNRWMKYGQLSSSYLTKAAELDTTNPRPDFLVGQSVLYTPAQFGGGKEKALPILKKAEEKFKNFKPESDIYPSWGEKMLEIVLQRIGESN
jgi:hypothetical protein